MGGIDSQYGFLFQEMVFIKYILQNQDRNMIYKYESLEDIELDVSSDKYYSLTINRIKKIIQVKSGNINYDVMKKIFANWIIIFSDLNLQDYECILELENDFELVKTDEFVKEFIESVKEGKTKKKTAILRKVYDLYTNEKNEFAEERLKSLLLLLIKKMTKQINSFQNVKEESLKFFKTDYCADIKVFELAKEKRFERLVGYIKNEIDKSIENKESLELTFSKFNELKNRSVLEVSDDKYSENFSLFKRGKDNIVKNIIESNKREVVQLKNVKDDAGFIIDRLVEMLFYQDLREFYYDINEHGLEDLELTACSNYKDTLFGLCDEERGDPYKIFKETTKLNINSSLITNLPSTSFYNKGVYIYLTKDEIESDKQISWRLLDEY